MMTAIHQHEKPATVHDIQEIVGPCDDEVLASIVAIEATRDEILEAFAWLGSDDYPHRKRHHTMRGRPAEVFAILEAEFPAIDRR